MTTTGTGAYRFEWQDNWARIADTESGRTNGRTHGVAVVESGETFVFHQADPSMLVFDARGRLKASWGPNRLGAHGLTRVRENGSEFLWITDQSTCEVAKLTLDGQVVQRIERPNHPVYAKAQYSPTWVAVNEERRGGNGDIWVTDGYGSFWIHRYDRKGRYLASISGEEGGAGRFQCPHGIAFDWRRGQPELYVADRGNRRVQVYDAEGRWQRVFGADFLTSPDGFCELGDALVVPELLGRVTVLDAEDRLACRLGENEPAPQIPGWPEVPVDRLEAGKFNSPHGAASDPDGNLYVVEWIVGGRITRLRKV